MGRKFTYDEVKDFIENKSKSGCFLKSESYKGVYKKISIECICGNVFITTFANFKYNNKRKCDTCQNKWDIENIKKYITNRNYVLLKVEYKNWQKYITFKDKNGYLYYSSIDSFFKSKNPSIVYKNNPYTIQNIKLWLKLNDRPFELLSDTYINAHKKLKWKCLKEECKEEFDANWSHIRDGGGCAVCDGRQVCSSNCLATKNPELAKEWHPTKNRDLTPYDVTEFSNKKVWWRCKKCNYEWKVSINNRSNLKGCPQCNESKGEKIIKKYLNKNNIDYIWQKEFKNLIGINNYSLSYDFYLPKYNLLIEYQGEQHKKPTDFEGRGKRYANMQFEKQLEHDRRKREYAQKNNINLLEIWYYDFDRIEEILSNIILKKDI